MELGLYSFAENTPDPLNGGKIQSPAERLRDLIEEIELADQLGLAFYGLGEHHRPDYVASSPVTILAAAAAQPQDLRSSTRRATKALEDLLGPACEPLALQLEKCKSMAELQAKILELRTVVASMRSEKKAEEFVAAALGR